MSDTSSPLDSRGRAAGGGVSAVAAPALTRLVAADHPDRRIAEPSTMGALLLRIDPTHELPIVIATEDGQTVARFSRPGDAAFFCGPAGSNPQAVYLRGSLPAVILDQLAAMGT